MFSFIKYATLVFSSLESVTYVKNSRAESNGYVLLFSLLYKVCFEFLYRKKAACARTAQCKCPCAVSVKQPPTLKGATSLVAFRYVPNLEAFWKYSRIPVSRFNYVV